MFKRLTCIALCLCLLASATACNKDPSSSEASGSTPGQVDTGMKEGEPAAPNDVFTLPEVARSGDSAPVIAGVSKQAGPDDSVIVTGTGFSESDTKVYVYAQTTADNGKATEAQFTVAEDSTMQVLIDQALPYGMYGIYVENANGTSNLALVNKPSIWWISLAAVTAGDEVSIYGENLTTENKGTSYVYLLSDDGKYCQTEIISADPYRVTFRVPEGLEDQKSYTVRLHNGHGGSEGFASAEEKLNYHASALYNWEEGSQISVVDHGADPADEKNDDSQAIQKAINAASDGDTIYFPKGTYLCKSNISSSKYLRFLGESTDETVIVAGNDLKEYLFNVAIGPTEFANLSFEHLRKSGRIACGFIQMRGDGVATDLYNLYIHDCDFAQSVTPVSRSIYFPISLISTYGAIIDNNNFVATALMTGRNAEKVFVRNNHLLGYLYCGSTYYNQNTIFMVDSDKYDVSGNYLAGKDIETDDTGVLDSDDLTTGRAMAIQGYANNLYLSNNKFERTGLPNDNAGEQIMLENLTHKYFGEIVSSTETDLVMPDSFTTQVARGDVITIVSGTGKSQYRSVTRMKGKTITLDSPWDVLPDETSLVLITRCFNNIVIHNNTMDGYTNYSEDPGATCGVQAYGGINNMFITGNHFKNMPYGMCISTHWFTAASKERKNKTGNIIYWSIIADNTIENVNQGVRHNVVTDNSAAANELETSIGVLYRKNSISNVTDYIRESWKGHGGVGIAMGTVDAVDGFKGTSGTWPGKWLSGCLIENNVFSNCSAADVYFYKHQGNTLVRNNKGDDGEMQYKVSALGEEPILVNN